MSTKIVVGNLPLEIEADFVEQLCSGEPTVIAVNLRKNGIGRSLGFAVIDVSNPSSAARLVRYAFPTDCSWTPVVREPCGSKPRIRSTSPSTFICSMIQDRLGWLLKY